MEEAVTDDAEPRLNVATIGCVKRFPAEEGRRADCKRGRQERDRAVGIVRIALLDGARRLDDSEYVPIRILKAVEAFVERAVAGAVAIAEDEVIDVAKTPDELALGPRRNTGALFDDLPPRGVVVEE